jgi:hypothetical protein
MLQQSVERWHMNDYINRMQEDGTAALVGQTIRGVPITMEGLLAVAHLGGYQGMRNFVESGGAANPQDAYGTTLMSYFTRHGSGQPVTLQAPQGATQLTENVWATPGRTVLTTMQGASTMTQPYAEERMAQVLSGPFQQLQQFFGAPITINDAIAMEGTSRESDTPGSRHFHGDALDLNISGMSAEEQLRLVRAAHAAGFRGFGFGENVGILHIDMGAARSWAYGGETFAGLPIAEVQAMVANGDFSGEFPMSAGGVTESGIDAVARGLAASNAAPDSEPGAPAPTNFTVYEQGETERVEQGPETSVTTPSQPSAAGSAMMTEAQKIGQVSPEIMDLINQLTGNGDEQAIRELEEFLRQRATPMNAAGERGAQ